jgi:hypothetical protein
MARPQGHIVTVTIIPLADQLDGSIQGVKTWATVQAAGFEDGSCVNGGSRYGHDRLPAITIGC